MPYKNLALFTFLISVVFGCGHDAKSKAQKSTVRSSIKKDSILFTMQNKNFKATLRETNEAGRGSANGPRLFQRRGSLHFVLSELYGDNPIILHNNPYPRKNYKINIRWYQNTDFKKVRKRVLWRIKKTLNYQTKNNNTIIIVYHLFIANNARLNRATNKNLLPGGVNYKSTIHKGQWNIIASLPTFAEKLSEKLNEPVRAKQIHLAALYHFKLDLQEGKDDLKKELKNKYGIILKPKKVPVNRVTVFFPEHETN